MYDPLLLSPKKKAGSQHVCKHKSIAENQRVFLKLGSSVCCYFHAMCTIKNVSCI